MVTNSHIKLAWFVSLPDRLVLKERVSTQPYQADHLPKQRHTDVGGGDSLDRILFV